ncbi:MAG: hypothetical protein GXO71_02485 [Caldiserica bacterium]|nr:hypothetical protein [Caldisericota bacterium]
MGERYKDNRVEAGLYSLRTAKIDSFPKKKDIPHQEEIMSICMEALHFIMKEILHPAVNFTADDEDARYCKYCPFFYLCR